MIVPKKIYITTGSDYRGNRYSIATDDLNGQRHKNKIRLFKDIIEELIENIPNSYIFKGLIRSNPLQLAELYGTDGNLYRVKSGPIIDAIITYGCDPGGGLKAQLIWKKVNGYFGLYIA